jgi:hypothetical protein
MESRVTFPDDSSPIFKIIWDTGASKVVTSNPNDTISGYVTPSTHLHLQGVSSGALVEGIGLVDYSFRADDNCIISIRLNAYYMPHSLPLNICLVPPRRHCQATGGIFTTTGTGATLQLPSKPLLTLLLDPTSNLPCCLGHQTTFVFDQSHAINLCVTAGQNQNLTTSQKLLLLWHYCF